MTVEQSRFLCTSLEENMAVINREIGNSDDFISRDMTVCGFGFCCLTMENLCDKQQIEQQIIRRLMSVKSLPKNGKQRFEAVESGICASPDQKKVQNIDELYRLIMSGWAALLFDGCDSALCIGVQDTPTRSITEPGSEISERGSEEGFSEILRNNMAMVRRRMKTKDLKFEIMTLGDKSRTDIALCYMEHSVDSDILEKVRKRLFEVEIDAVLDSGYLVPFLDTKTPSLFPSVGVTERPDTLCGKILEGRIGILVDGTPYALTVPLLFSEHFQSPDDYTLSPFFATFIRCLKYLSFILAVLVSGTYVAICEHNPELFPAAILHKVFDSGIVTPFPNMWEALIIHVIYEIMREAGLRLPKSVGHAVSIVGGLVIGEAAVTAGLIGAPMVIVVATTALASYVVPTLYYPCALLRFAGIFIGGLCGTTGMVLFAAVIVTAVCGHNVYGVPLSAPVSPFDKSSVRDTLLRQSWRTLAKRTAKIQKLHGSKEEDAR